MKRSQRELAATVGARQRQLAVGHPVRHADTGLAHYRIPGAEGPRHLAARRESFDLVVTQQIEARAEVRPLRRERRLQPAERFHKRVALSLAEHALPFRIYGRWQIG